MDQGTTISGLTRRWRLAGPVEVPAPPGLVERVLAARGLDDPQRAQAFLNPSLLDLHDPSAIPGLDRAAERIVSALRSGEPLVIYSDYDVDGVTGAAILVHTCRAIAPESPVETYIPHRVDEGYGLSGDALRSIADRGVRLIVTVDCGITAVEPARLASALGLDLIITDHHALGPAVPEACAVVHPGLPGSEYPFPHLCGAGVAYKLAWRLATLWSGSERVPDDLRGHLVQMLALAALGTVADVVPLTGENRAITRFGLARVRTSSIPGLVALVQAANLAGERTIDEYHAGFAIGPRLNAAGRLDHAKEALELLITDDPGRAAALAAQLCRLNNRRRYIEQRIAEQAEAMAQERGMTGPDRRAIVLAHRDWHPGVVGIACSRLVERFGRPVVLLHDAGDALAGSARSVAGFDIHEALTRCGHLLETFGGHAMAAGLRLAPERLDAFTDLFTRVANEGIAADDLVASITVDTHARIGELTADTVAELDRLKPFGSGNPRVRLMIRRATVAGSPRLMGSSGKHLRLFLRQGDSAVRCVAWNWGEHAGVIHPGATVDAVVSPKISTFGGPAKVECELRDVRIVEQ